MYLKEVVFEEISKRFVLGYRPPSIVIQVEEAEQDDQDKSTQLSFVANGYKHHQYWAQEIL